MVPGISTELRAVLFDFGGVLAEEGFRDGLRALARQQSLETDALVHEGFRAVHDSGYVTGQGSESGFWELLRQRTGLRGSDSALRNAILSRFVIRPWILGLAQALRDSGYQVAILSDQTDWLECLNQRYRFYFRFDRIFNSYRLGKSKRDVTLFDDVVTALGLAPPQVLFIDDNEGNVDRARSRGLRTILYRQRHDVETSLRELLRQAAVSPTTGVGQ